MAPRELSERQMLGQVFDIQDLKMSDFAALEPEQIKHIQALKPPQRSVCKFQPTVLRVCKLFLKLGLNILYEENKMVYLRTDDGSTHDALKQFGVKVWNSPGDKRIDSWTAIDSIVGPQATESPSIIRPIITMTLNTSRSEQISSMLLCLEDLPHIVRYFHIERQLRNCVTAESFRSGGELWLLLEHGLRDGLEKLLLCPFLPWVGADCTLDGLWSWTPLSALVCRKAMDALTIYRESDRMARQRNLNTILSGIVVAFVAARTSLENGIYRWAESQLVLLMDQLGDYFRCRVIDHQRIYLPDQIDYQMRKDSLECRVYLATTYFLSLLRSNKKCTTIGSSRSRATTAVLNARASLQFQRFCMTPTEWICLAHFVIIKNCVAIGCWGLALSHMEILNKVVLERAQMIVYNPNTYGYRVGYQDLEELNEAFNEWWRCRDARDFKQEATYFLFIFNQLISRRWGNWEQSKGPAGYISLPEETT